MGLRALEVEEPSVEPLSQPHGPHTGSLLLLPGSGGLQPKAWGQDCGGHWWLSGGEKDARKFREEAGPGPAWPSDRPGHCPGASLRGWGSRWMVLSMVEQSG